MKEKKVLFVASVLGHVTTFHTPYLKMFKENNWKTYVFAKKTINNINKLEFCDKFYDEAIERNPLSIINIKEIKKLKNIIDIEKFDIIHCHTPIGAVITRLASKKARKKYDTRVIYTVHGFHFYKGAPLKNWLIFYPVEWYLSKFTDTIITINNEDYEFAKKHFSNRCKDIQYVPGVGIDTKKFNITLSDKEKENLRKYLGLKQNDYVLTCVARLDKNKNQHFLIKAMKKIVEINSNIHLLLIGPDELNGYYQSKVKKYNLEKNIHFLGKKDDIPELLKITNVVVSASKREGLPVNVMESLASNIPVVALNCRGMSDLITNNENGYIVNNQKEFIDKVLKIKNKNTLNKIKLDQKFIISSVEKEMKKIYKI